MSYTTGPIAAAAAILPNQKLETEVKNGAQPLPHLGGSLRHVEMRGNKRHSGTSEVCAILRRARKY